MYATARPFDCGDWYVQMVIECRQDGRHVIRRQETMGFDGDPRFTNDVYKVCGKRSLFSAEDGIERLSERPQECIPYKVYVRTFSDPKAKSDNPKEMRQMKDNRIPDPEHERYRLDGVGLETLRSPVDGNAGEFRYIGGKIVGKWL